MNANHRGSGHVPAISHSPVHERRANAGGRHEVISHPSAPHGAGPLSNLPGSDWTELLALGALFLFAGFGLGWSFPG